MSFTEQFEAAFHNGLVDIKFFVRRGKTVSVDDLKKDAVAFQSAISDGRAEKVNSVD